MKGKRETIKIKKYEGFKKVRAICFGDYGIVTGGTTVTHIPSGMVVCSYSTFQSARTNAVHLHEKMTESWDGEGSPSSDFIEQLKTTKVTLRYNQ